MKLTLETKQQKNETLTLHASGGGMLMITPPVDEDYWLYRVQVGHGQAIIGFPKFCSIGVGFAKETDWNTNLPSTCETEKIWNHIKHNKGNKNIKRADCIAAIRMIQEAAEKATGKEPNEAGS